MVFSAAMLRVVDSDKNAFKKGDASGNAITAVEIFRQYPSLSEFICAVLRDGVPRPAEAGQQQHPSLVRARSETLLHPPIFLVLLLLARIQPVSRAGSEAAVHTNLFIEFVLKSLEHRHHKIRVVAARALANLSTDERDCVSSRDRLLEYCRDKVKEGTSGKKNLNLVHGSLLGIEELIKCGSNPTLDLHTSGNSSLLASLCNEASIHPSCLATAIQIWHYATMEGQCTLDNMIAFARRCVEIIRKSNSGSNVPSRVNVSPLSVACGRAASEVSARILWDVTIDRTTVDIASKILNDLFTSEVIDVRIAAVKVFKKGIYANIDAIVDNPQIGSDEKDQILRSSAHLLLGSVMKQWGADPLGQHQPTVRRLTRCLLEVLMAHRSLEGLNSTHQDSIVSMDQLWETAKSIIGTDCSDPDNAVLGNALEMMATALSASAPGCTPSVEKAQALASIAKNLNDPLGPWRVRYSVAISIELSGILEIDAGSLNAGDGQVWTTIQFGLYKELLTLMQDNDPDCRFIAGRSMQGSSVGSAQLLSIEKGFEALGEKHSGAAMNSWLWDTLASSVKDLQVKINDLCVDFAASETISDGEAEPLLNLDTSRKIFEEENANPYEEPWLTCQLVVLSIVRAGDYSGISADVSSEILSVASSVLKALCNRIKKAMAGEIANDPLHDVTRDKFVFGGVHTLLLTSTLLIFAGVEGAAQVQLVAQAIVRLLESDRSPAIHSKIAFMLKMFATARSSSGSKDFLSASCFLVPTRGRSIIL